MLMERMRALLPQSVRNTLSVDISGNVIAGGVRIGVHEKCRFLIDHGPMFSHIPFPVAMRTMVQAGKLITFIEVTESEASICAGSALGQKTVYSKLS
jgi:hypothetical protein